MAPTPYLAGYQLDIHYTVPGLSHTIQLPVDAQNISSGVYEVVRKTLSNRTPAQCFDKFTSLAKTFYNTAVEFTGWTLQQYTGGVFVPVQAAAGSVFGTKAAATIYASQLTLTYRDLDYHFARQVFAEPVFVVPFHDGYPSGDADLNAFIASCLPAAVGTDSIFEFVKSRGASYLNSIVGISGTVNRKTRRKRGL